jgi:hypothetical protein
MTTRFIDGVKPGFTHLSGNLNCLVPLRLCAFAREVLHPLRLTTVAIPEPKSVSREAAKGRRGEGAKFFEMVIQVVCDLN